MSYIERVEDILEEAGVGHYLDGRGEAQFDREVFTETLNDIMQVITDVLVDTKLNALERMKAHGR